MSPSPRELLVTAQDDTPWWSQQPPELTTHSGPSWVEYWATKGLMEQALTSGKTVFSGRVGGYLKDPLLGEYIISEVEDRGGVCVQRGIQSCCGYSAVYAWSHGIVKLNVDGGENGYVSCDLASTRESWLYMLTDIINKCITQKQPVSMRRGRIFMMGVTPNGVQFFRLPGYAAVPMQRANYMPGVVSQINSSITELNSRTPNGRLTILDGPPGTGKTFLIYGLIHEVPSGMFIFVPPGMIEQLGDPSFVPALLRLGESKSTGPSIFVIEDADKCLVARNESNIGSISALLNLTSGVLGRMLDIRVVASSNAKAVEIDEALRRKGRLSQHITVGNLDRNQCSSVYDRLVSQPWVGNEAPLADVYNEAINSGWQMPSYEEEIVEVTDVVQVDECGDVPEPESNDIDSDLLERARMVVKRRMSSVTESTNVQPPSIICSQE